VYYMYVTTKTDSIDHRLYQHLHGCPHPNEAAIITSNGGESGSGNGTDGNNNDDTKYCWVCQTTVHHESMHCKYCDKCVATFDHHCMWLNTCIGAANYDTFFKTVVFTFSFVTIHMSSLVVFIALYFTSTAKITMGMEDVGSEEQIEVFEEGTVRYMSAKWYFGANQPIVVLSINLFFLAWTASASFLVLQLLVFHLGLKREKITTYSYIIRDSARKRDRMILGQKIRARRVDELESAGNTCEAACLKMGGWKMCRPCDPVKKLVLQEADQADENESLGNNDSQVSNNGNGTGGGGSGGGNNASSKNDSNSNGNTNGKGDEFKDDDEEKNNSGSGEKSGKQIDRGTSALSNGDVGNTVNVGSMCGTDCGGGDSSSNSSATGKKKERDRSISSTVFVKVNGGGSEKENRRDDDIITTMVSSQSDDDGELFDTGVDNKKIQLQPSSPTAAAIRAN